MKFSHLMFVAAMLAAPASAFADTKVEGQWRLDVAATVAAAKASGQMPPDALKKMEADLAGMGESFSLSFTGPRLQAIAGPSTTNCTWAWADDYVVPSQCLDQKGKPNDLDPEKQAIRFLGKEIHLIDKPSGMALILRRG